MFNPLASLFGANNAAAAVATANGSLSINPFLLSQQQQQLDQQTVQAAATMALLSRPTSAALESLYAAAMLSAVMGGNNNNNNNNNSINLNPQQQMSIFSGLNATGGNDAASFKSRLDMAELVMNAQQQQYEQFQSQLQHFHMQFQQHNK